MRTTLVLVGLSVAMLAGCAPANDAEATGTSSAEVNGFSVVDHSDPIPNSVFDELIDPHKLKESDLDQVYRISHDIDVAPGRRIHATESFTLRSWLRFPHRAMILIPGPVTNAAFFDIPVDGYDSGAILAGHGYFAFTVDLEGVGLSSFPPNGQVCDTARSVADLTPVLDVIRAERWVPKVDVFGESWGGGIAAELCAEHSARSCVMSSMLYKTTTAFGASNFLTPEFHAYLDSLTTGYFPTTAPFYEQFVAASPTDVQTYTYASQPGLYADASLYAPYNMPFFDPTHARVPGLIVFGAQDPTVPLSDAQEALRRLRTARCKADRASGWRSRSPRRNRQQRDLVARRSLLRRLDPRRAVMSTLRGMGILGLGLWDGPIVTNDAFPDVIKSAIDPYKGKRDDEGTIRIAGLELRASEYPRTIAAIEQGFADPFRGSLRRRIMPKDMLMSDAEAAAGRAALANAEVDPADVDIVLVQSFLPDQLQPRNAALVASKVGVKRGAAWEVDSICNSSISQLHVASSLIAAGQARHVLCTQSVAYSRVRDPGVSASFQEGDLASAFVVGPRDGANLTFAWETDGSLHAAIRLAWDAPTGAVSRRYWESAPEKLVIRWEDVLQQKVMAEVGTHARKVCEEALGRAEMKLDDVDVFVTHHPMNWFVAFMEDTLGLRDGVSISTFEDYASVNSACVPASLALGVKQDRIRPGSRVLIFCPGAGYTYGAVALRW